MNARVSVLTPPGTGAIATVEVAGPEAWAAVSRLFRPAGRFECEVSHVAFGTFGDGAGDEVVVAVKQVGPEPVIELHCHGGRRVVAWVAEQFVHIGCRTETPKPTDGSPWGLLERAPTLRTANVLLDQCHGAFDAAVRSALQSDDPIPIVCELMKYADVGRHLIEPWRVVIAGAPNVGKSSLVNALAGYQRSIVTPVAGTTRDVVTTAVAFDGWPVELADTAGIRGTADIIEGEGIALAWEKIGRADLRVWLVDATAEQPAWPMMESLLVFNKVDQPLRVNVAGELRVSAATGFGIPELITAILQHLVPAAPPPGAPVPYTPALADAIVTADRLLAAGKLADARSVLATTLTPPEPAD